MDWTGTEEWWESAPVWGARGIVDTVLRLLEQEEITRSKAREILEDYFGKKPGDVPHVPWVPRAPWDKLNWSG